MLNTPQLVIGSAYFLLPAKQSLSNPINILKNWNILYHELFIMNNALSQPWRPITKSVLITLCHFIFEIPSLRRMVLRKYHQLLKQISRSKQDYNKILLISQDRSLVNLFYATHILKEKYNSLVVSKIESVSPWIFNTMPYIIFSHLPRSNIGC